MAPPRRYPLGPNGENLRRRQRRAERRAERPPTSCAVGGCRRLQPAYSSQYCGSHKRRARIYGHPEARPLRALDTVPMRRRVSRLRARLVKDGHADLVDLALRICAAMPIPPQRLRRYQKQGPSRIPLRRTRVPSHEILDTALAVWLYVTTDRERSDAKALLPNDGICLTFAIGRAVLRRAGARHRMHGRAVRAVGTYLREALVPYYRVLLPRIKRTIANGLRLKAARSRNLQRRQTTAGPKKSTTAPSEIFDVTNAIRQQGLI